MPELTVVVPVYNGARWLEATLTSLQRQEDVDLEVIVVDDGSTDESADLVERHPVAARLIRQQNAGVAIARNRGAVAATAPFVGFVDQDDLWHPRRSRLLLDLVAKEGALAASTTETAFAVEQEREALHAVGDGRETWPAIWVDAGSEVDALLTLSLETLGGSGAVDQVPVTRFLEAPASVTTSAIFSREHFLAAGGCATWIKAADDHVLNVCFTQHFGPIARVDVPCLFYRVHPASTTTVSPLAAAYLSMLYALRRGRVLPPDPVSTPYVQHLLGQLPTTGLPPLEQLSLLTLAVPAGGRPKAWGRWAKRRVVQLVRGVRNVH